ncbi:elongation factor P [Qipengyuania flava]|uniref:elongation factor P n=1 Tax=Qipengyuania flava TaxID=192812 RepID=UPI00215A95FD|nr:elongation factor P [Qipengyuania flava]
MTITRTLTLLAAAVGLVASPAASQGRLALLDRGEYVCALPGDATGAAWVEQEGRDFAITGGSSYRTARGTGTYLLEGKQVTFTRGPMRGTKFMRLGSGMLQEIGRDGKLGRLRCHRAGGLKD